MIQQEEFRSGRTAAVKKKPSWSFVFFEEEQGARHGYGSRLTGIKEKIAGSRDKEGALVLWSSLPESCGKTAVSHSGFRAAYEEVSPPGRHFPAGKESGKASHVERLNLTLRRRAPRLGIKTPPFSENMKNHIGAILKLIHHCNENIAPNLATAS